MKQLERSEAVPMVKTFQIREPSGGPTRNKDYSCLKRQKSKPPVRTYVFLIGPTSGPESHLMGTCFSGSESASNSSY